MDALCPYLDGLQGATEEHVVGGYQRAHRVVMGPDSVHLLQVLDVPHLKGWMSSLRAQPHYLELGQ